MGRPYPRISLLKLAEYMGANPLRRRAIVRDQWDPPDQVVPQYRRAMAAALSFFRSGGQDVATLLTAADQLGSSQPNSEWDERDLRNSAEALRHLAEVACRINLGDRILSGRRRLDRMMMSGVEVSVRAQVRAVRLEPDAPRVGAVKLAFSKTRPLPREEALRATTLLRHSLAIRLGEAEAEVEPALCQVVDVFREEVYHAPVAFKRTMKRAEAACEEIALTWPSRNDRRSPPPLPPIYPIAS